MGIILQKKMNPNLEVFMKRFFSTLIIFLCILSFVCADNRPAEWAVNEVDSAIAVGLVPNELQKDYQEPITREEFCLLAVKLIETINEKNSSDIMKERGIQLVPSDTFNDCQNPAVLVAYSLGITKGTGAAQFSPNASLTREQAATLLMKTAMFCGNYNDEELKASTDNLFSDMSSIANWARQGVIFVKDFQIMNGVSENNFAPKATYQRQQAYVTMFRLYQAISKQIAPQTAEVHQSKHRSDLFAKSKFIKKLSIDEALSMLNKEIYPHDFTAEYYVYSTGQVNKAFNDIYRANIYYHPLETPKNAFLKRTNLYVNGKPELVCIYNSELDESSYRGHGSILVSDKGIITNPLTSPEIFTQSYLQEQIIQPVIAEGGTVKASLEEIEGEQVLHINCNQSGGMISDYWISLKTNLPVQIVILIENEYAWGLDECRLTYFPDYDYQADKQLFDIELLKQFKFSY